MSPTSIPATRKIVAPGFTGLTTVHEIAVSPESAVEQGRQLCAQLEEGNIVMLPQTPIFIPEEDRRLLLGQKQASSAYRKNIAYLPSDDRVTGLDGAEHEEVDSLRRIMRDYSRRSAEFLNLFLPPYARKWKLDFASFRPIEEQGRLARLHARTDLLHFESFPARPTNGARILQLFTNINPVQNRVWLTSQTFEAFGPRFARAAGLISLRHNLFKHSVGSVTRALGLSEVERPPYDEFMYRCQNAMKKDARFQETSPKHRWEFPPNSTWLVFTDGVSHAVFSGQYALEQTFLIPQSALVEPQRSPLAILEKMAGRSLTI